MTLIVPSDPVGGKISADDERRLKADVRFQILARRRRHQSIPSSFSLGMNYFAVAADPLTDDTSVALNNWRWRAVSSSRSASIQRASIQIF